MTNTTKPGNADIKARLLNYRQIDCDGVDVAVPREVLHSAFDRIEQLERALAEASIRNEALKLLRDDLQSAIDLRIALWQNGCDCRAIHTCDPMQDKFAGKWSKSLSATAPDKVTAHVAQQVPDARVGDLSALVVRLVRQLNKAAPANSLPGLAMDYMRRNGFLYSGLRSDLRDTDAETKAIHELLVAASGVEE